MYGIMYNYMTSTLEGLVTFILGYNPSSKCDIYLWDVYY